MKKIISSLLAGAIVLSGVSAMASDINITIDNEEFIPKNALGETVSPFIENGSTYLPVRAMGEAVGKTVKFDAENYAVYIGEEPLDADKIREAFMLVGDRIIYKDEIEDFEIVPENIYEMVRVIKLAEKKFTKEEIAAGYNEIISHIDDADYIEQQKEITYYVACNYLLNTNVPENCADYDKYATVQHILVEDEGTAVKVIDELNSGRSMEDLIEGYNIDPGQKKNSSYTFTYGEMVEEFEKAAFELKVNEYTAEPVKSNYGYHVILRLPLNAEVVDASYYQSVILPEELKNVDLGRIVEIKKTGVVGNLEGFEITSDVLEALSDETAEEIFEALTAMAFVRAIMEQNSLFVEEREEYRRELDIILEMTLESKTDEKALNYITDLFAAFLVYMEKFSNGNVVKAEVAELFENEENHPVIKSERYRDIKVFVDGKLIIPCDVNNNYVEPKNVDGTVFVPMRAIVEALGMKADWDNDTRTVVITK